MCVLDLPTGVVRSLYRGGRKNVSWPRSKYFPVGEFCFSLRVCGGPGEGREFCPIVSELWVCLRRVGRDFRGVRVGSRPLPEGVRLLGAGLARAFGAGVRGKTVAFVTVAPLCCDRLGYVVLLRCGRMPFSC